MPDPELRLLEELTERVSVDDTDFMYLKSAALENFFATIANLRAAFNVGGSSNTIVAPAGADLAAYRLVGLRDDGTVTYLDAADVADAAVIPLLTTEAALTGVDVECLGWGEVTNPSWTWTPEAPVFVGLGGALTQTVPTFPTYEFSRIVGQALDATTLLLAPQDAIVLGGVGASSVMAGARVETFEFDVATMQADMLAGVDTGIVIPQGALALTSVWLDTALDGSDGSNLQCAVTQAGAIDFTNTDAWLVYVDGSQMVTPAAVRGGGRWVHYRTDTGADVEPFFHAGWFHALTQAERVWLGITDPTAGAGFTPPTTGTGRVVVIIIRGTS